MKRKEFAVFGLGNYGMSVAKTLAQSGCEVIVADNNADKIQEISDTVTYAVKADLTDAEVFKTLGLSNVDVAIVAITNSIEASVMATIMAKEEGVPYVVAKANNDIHATVLKKVGADEIVFPEKSMGSRTAKNLISGNFVDIIELAKSFSMVEMRIPQDWVGKTLKEIDVRTKLGINVIAIKNGDEVNVNLNPDEPMQEDATMIIVGYNANIDKIQK